MADRTSDLIVLDKMCERDKDIRMAKLPDNFVNCRRVKAGGHLTIGVDDSCASILMNMALGAKDYGAALIIYKREHFDEIKTELKNGIPLPHLGDPCLCGKVTEGCTLDRETLYNRVIELQGKLLEAVKPKSTLNEMFPGEFSGALPGSIESKWAAEKNTLTPEQAKEFDPKLPGARVRLLPETHSIGKDPTEGYALKENAFGRFIIIPSEAVPYLAWTGKFWSSVDGAGNPFFVQVCNFTTEVEAHEYVAGLNKQAKPGE